MDKEEYYKRIGELTEEALSSDMSSIEIIAVLETCKITTVILMHERVKEQGVI